MTERVPRRRPRWAEIAVMAAASAVLLAAIVVYERGVPWLAAVVLPPIWVPYFAHEPVRARPLTLILVAGVLVLLLLLGLFIAIR